MGKRLRQPGVCPCVQYPVGFGTVVFGQTIHGTGLRKLCLGLANARERAVFNKRLGCDGDQCLALAGVGGRAAHGHAAAHAVPQRHKGV